MIKSIKDGEWILLDEINLASESVLNRLATLIDGDYILLNERADIVETNRHKDFRLFLCMNPPYTSAGKKQLPWSLRSKLTEVYVPELDNQSDLWIDWHHFWKERINYFSYFLFNLLKMISCDFFIGFAFYNLVN